MGPGQKFRRMVFLHRSSFEAFPDGNINLFELIVPFKHLAYVRVAQDGEAYVNFFKS